MNIVKIYPLYLKRLNRSLKVIKPKSLFILNDKPIILFFDKSVNKEEIFKQCWNFSEAPIIIIENESDFDIYNGFDYVLENVDFLLIELSKNNELNVEGKTVSLGNKEALLLKLFMKTEGEVLAHERIYKHLWDFDEEPSDTALRTYIKNLRKIIGKERIVSIKKQGYKFIAQK
jgi:Response regulators consisting of a CheY-like receiver domain and a winged-helix DNA-binding domain